jgi:hypothetical protein
LQIASTAGSKVLWGVALWQLQYVVDGPAGSVRCVRRVTKPQQDLRIPHDAQFSPKFGAQMGDLGQL